MASRYYDQTAEGEIRPGKISAKLREALNIPENDIPIWIYRMRALGYPPGWLNKAVVDTNDIFDTDDQASGKRKKPSEVQYDHAKLVEYPGFNAPMPANCVDYHYYINMPPMLEHQQLEFAKKHMSAPKPAPMPEIGTTPISTPQATSSNTESPNQSSISNPELHQSEPQDPESPDHKQNEEDTDSKPSLKKLKSEKGEPQIEGIKLVSKGSPMPKPVERAPLERFSEGVVGDLLYFETLPNSTGQFGNIRGLLNNIRKSKAPTADTSLESNKSL